MLTYSRPVHSTPGRSENGGFALKTHLMFSGRSTSEEFKNTTITGHFGFCLKKLGQGNLMIIVRSPLSKSSVSKTCFLLRKLKAGAGVF